MRLTRFHKLFKIFSFLYFITDSQINLRLDRLRNSTKNYAPSNEVSESVTIDPIMENSIKIEENSPVSSLNSLPFKQLPVIQNIHEPVLPQEIHKKYSYANLDPESKWIYQILKENQPFTTWPESRLCEMSIEAEKFSAAKGAYITRAGDKGDAVYMIQDGSAEVIGNGKCVHILRERQMFGIRSCLNNIEKTASVKTRENTVFLSIAQEFCKNEEKTESYTNLRGKLSAAVFER